MGRTTWTCKATALAALLIVVLPASLAVAKLTDEERREMKERVQKEIQRGKVPEATPDMSFEERLYIKKKQQALEKEKQAQQPSAPAPPTPSAPPPRPEKDNSWKKRPEKEENWRHRPEHHSPAYRPFDHHYDRYPSHSHDWRRERCRRLWGGSGYEYHRCLDGETRYLFPENFEESNTTIIIEPPPAPVIVQTPPAAVVPFVDPDGQPDLRADRHEVWFDAEVTGESIITARDSFGKPRRFHLVGIGQGENPDFTISCITEKLGNNRTVRINEVGAVNDTAEADAEAVIFIGNRVLNLQVLNDGCAEFDARACSELQLSFCDTFQDAESAARRNRLGIWR